jgi:hypothetical protein
MIQNVIILVFTALASSFLCGAVDLGYVGGVDHAYGSGNLFATSVVQSKHNEQALDTIPPGRQLDTLTAEKVFGWQKVHKHNGALVGRKQDKAGRWRRAKVPNYSTNPLHSYSVENRMKQLVERSDQYPKELAKITHAKDIPSDWASPDQRCRAAIKAVGQ